MSVKKIKVLCENCGKGFLRYNGEVNRSRKIGRGIFCSQTCGSLYNAVRSEIVTKNCPYCHTDFQSTTHNKAGDFCSRSCASKGSMYAHRREAQRQAGREHVVNLEPGRSLKVREAWKYAKLKRQLGDRPHEFEFRLGQYVFDLVLQDTKTIVEFDGREHLCAQVAKIDKKKTRVAEKAGFTVVRRRVKANTVISPKKLIDL